MNRYYAETETTNYPIVFYAKDDAEAVVLAKARYEGLTIVYKELAKDQMETLYSAP